MEYEIGDRKNSRSEFSLGEKKVYYDYLLTPVLFHYNSRFYISSFEHFFL